MNKQCYHRYYTLGKSLSYVAVRNDRRGKKVGGEHAPLTGRYFEPCEAVAKLENLRVKQTSTMRLRRMRVLSKKKCLGQTTNVVVLVLVVKSTAF